MRLPSCESCTNIGVCCAYRFANKFDLVDGETAPEHIVGQALGVAEFGRRCARDNSPNPQTRRRTQPKIKTGFVFVLYHHKHHGLVLACRWCIQSSTANTGDGVRRAIYLQPLPVWQLHPTQRSWTMPWVCLVWVLTPLCPCLGSQRHHLALRSDDITMEQRVRLSIMGTVLSTQLLRTA